MNLERLLRERPFEALSLHERAEVLTEMSAEEYRRVREVALLAEQYLGEEADLPRPRPATQAQLHARLHARRRGMDWARSLLDYRLPLWQAAAAVALLVCTLHWVNRPATGLSPQPVTAGMLADSTHHDSALRTAFDPYEDSVVYLDRSADTL